MCAMILMVSLCLSGCSSEKVSEKEALSEQLVELYSSIDAYQTIQNKELEFHSQSLEAVNEYGVEFEKELSNIIVLVQNIITDTDAVDVEANRYLDQLRLFWFEVGSLRSAYSWEDVNSAMAKMNELVISFNDAEFRLISEMEKISEGN